MRVLFVCDFFPPFTRGGGEISAYWQAKKISKKGIKVIILAPRFQDKLNIKKEEFKMHWYYMPFKLRVFTPIIFLNPFFIVYLFWQITNIVKKEKITLIHCQGKYSMPAVFLAKLFLGIPIILSLRDYGGLCNHAFCLYKNKKACNIFSFFQKDFLVYYQNYIKKKNIFSFLAQLIMSYLGRINTLILSFFMKRADILVCISSFIKDVYVTNGFDQRKLKIIYNFPPVTGFKYTRLTPQISRRLRQYKYKILYAGKLSLGKGANFLIDAAKEITKTKKDVLFIFCGNVYYPIKKNNSPQTLFLGRVENRVLLKIMSLSDLVCVPSVWSEPLSRVVLEAFFLKKPVLSSTTGGLPELVNRTRSWLFRPNKKDLKKTILQALGEQKTWSQKAKIAKDFLSNLEKNEMKKLLSLYRSILR